MNKYKMNKEKYTVINHSLRMTDTSEKDTMNSMKMMLKFCETGDEGILDKIDYETLAFIYPFALYMIEKGIKVDLNRKIVNALSPPVRNFKVYIASMNLYGERAKIPDEIRKPIVVNVTSSQGKTNIDRLTFSPMTPSNYKGYYNFEAYWQSGKVFEGIPHKVSEAWWKQIDSPRRRYPNSKGKKVLYATFNGEKMDYITSRKKVYVPEYYEYIKDSDRLSQLVSMSRDSGRDIVVYDFDGPRNSDASVSIIECSLENLKAKINDTRFPFGHGYVVGASILGIRPVLYTS